MDKIQPQQPLAAEFGPCPYPVKAANMIQEWFIQSVDKQTRCKWTYTLSRGVTVSQPPDELTVRLLSS